MPAHRLASVCWRLQSCEAAVPTDVCVALRISEACRWRVAQRCGGGGGCYHVHSHVFAWACLCDAVCVPAQASVAFHGGVLVSSPTWVWTCSRMVCV